eukprot:15893-Heterococcus_DN1.PRE.2
MDNSTCTAEHTHIHLSQHYRAQRTHQQCTPISTHHFNTEHIEVKLARACNHVVACCRMRMPFAVAPTVTMQQSEPLLDLTYCCYSYGYCYYCYCCMVLRNVTLHRAQFQSMELCLLHTIVCSAQHTPCTQVSKLRDIMLY